MTIMLMKTTTATSPQKQQQQAQRHFCRSGVTIQKYSSAPLEGQCRRRDSHQQEAPQNCCSTTPLEIDYHLLSVVLSLLQPARNLPLPEISQVKCNTDSNKGTLPTMHPSFFCHIYLKAYKLVYTYSKGRLNVLHNRLLVMRM